jgi:cytidylate kinase
LIDRVVTIGGPPGSGKSSAGRKVAERLRLQFRAAGELFRSEASARRLSLLEFSRVAETDETIDRSLDDRMLAMAEPGRLLDGRVTGALCRRRGIPCYALLVTASPEVRYHRLARRDGGTVSEAGRIAQEREASERSRYDRFYGIDLDREPSDLTVDSSALRVEEVVERLVRYLEGEDPGGTR